MYNLRPPVKESFSEEEAAASLGLSISTLHILLDEHIFNDGIPRPANIRLTSSDLVLLEFWHNSTPNSKVVRMPHRA